MNPRINTYDGVLDMKERIKMLRKALDMTQQDFADHLGVKRNTVGQWECGINHVSNHSIVFICKEFNVNEEWLRNGSGDMFLSGCMPISNNKPSARLKLLRNTLNLTQQEFADRIGCKRNTVAKYEIDSSAPSTAVVSLICREFNVNEEWLRFGTGNIFTKNEFIETYEISVRLKYLRHILDISQQDFANSLGISRGNIAAYEVGKNNPSQSVISLICKTYDVNKEWLRFGTGEIFISDTQTSSFADRIKQLRHILGLTQQNFSDRLKIKRGAIANYEIGRNNPSDSVIALICREFNINEKWLCNGTGKIFKSDRDTAIVRLENLLASEPDDSFKHHFINKLADLSPGEWNSLEKAIDIFSNITKNRTDQ